MKTLFSLILFVLVISGCGQDFRVLAPNPQKQESEKKILFTFVENGSTVFECESHVTPECQGSSGAQQDSQCIFFYMHDQGGPVEMLLTLGQGCYINKSFIKTTTGDKITIFDGINTVVCPAPEIHVTDGENGNLIFDVNFTQSCFL